MSDSIKIPILLVILACLFIGGIYMGREIIKQVVRKALPEGPAIELSTNTEELLIAFDNLHNQRYKIVCIKEYKWLVHRGGKAEQMFERDEHDVLALPVRCE